MSATPADIAEAVKVRLNSAPAGTFAQAFTARRVYVPIYEIKEGVGLVVSVVPKNVARSSFTRNTTLKTVQIDIGVQKHIGAATRPDLESGNTVVDELMTLVEQIAAYCDFFGEAGDTGAKWTETANDPIYDPAVLHEKRTFQSVITLTFKLT